MQTFIYTLVVFLVVNTVAGIVVASLSIAGLDTTAVTLVGVAISTSSILVTVALYCSKKNINFFEATTLNVKPNFKQVLTGLLAVLGLIFALMPLVFLFVNFLTEHGFMTEGAGIDIPDNPGFLRIIFYIIVVCILPAFCEEVFMRGIIARGFSRWGIIPASLLSGFIFMLFHMNPAQTIYQFVLGVALAFFMLRGGSVWTAIIVHFFNNILAIALDFILSEQLQEMIFIEYWYLCAAGGALIAAAGIALFVKTTPNLFDKDFELKQRQAEIDSLPMRQDFVYEEEKPLAALPKAGPLETFFFAFALVVCAGMWVATLLM